ncbi:hypothetical protein AaE_007378 [Aphanomyces astaci]|uniref:Uncharacterized protein n=1 Tax=Aphanomyces astaci TaxID=112090 RepID=A0A6A5AE73_APHAT|nr:hypothetical protein AaE_007378 [Aphanomyces astaci]
MSAVSPAGNTHYLRQWRVGAWGGSTSKQLAATLRESHEHSTTIMESPVPKDTDGIDDDASSDDEDESTLGVSMLTLNDPSDNGGDSEDDPMQRFFDMLYKEYPMQVAKQISRVHIHHIFVSLPASHASRRQDERRTNGYLSSTLVYGEIDFRHFRTVFTSILVHIHSRLPFSIFFRHHHHVETS